MAWGDGENGERREGERTTEHTRETRERGRRRKGRGQCRRTEPEALKYIYIYMIVKHLLKGKVMYIRFAKNGLSDSGLTSMCVCDTGLTDF